MGLFFTQNKLKGIMAKRDLTPKSESMSKWYTQVIQQAKLADYSPVKGCMVIRPNGYGLWEHIQQSYQPMLSAMRVKNAYFPLFIPMSFLEKEADHVEGFAPELAVVTHAGGEELTEKLVVRPTSETIMYHMYSKWIQSHRDLPLKINQWNNVVRWEKRTNFFLRTTEFLWQEAHSAHATQAEALTTMYDALESYRKISEDFLAIPVVKGRKSESEKFAGAVVTTTIEALMPDGKALQSGTSHHLGQNFSKAKAFNISFQDSSDTLQYVWQNSWGLSTRIIGALIMTHGDDEGLVLPPRIAPTQVLVVNATKDQETLDTVATITDVLIQEEVRAEANTEIATSMGWKINDAELEGIPLVIVVGARELASGKVSVSVRYNHEKISMDIATLGQTIPKLLEDIQLALFDAAKQRQEALTFEASTFDDFKKIMTENRGFIKAFWCEDSACETAIKEETKATTRCLPFTNHEGDVEEAHGTCVHCGKPATHTWLFAQAY